MDEERSFKLIKSTPREATISKLASKSSERQQRELQLKLSGARDQFMADFLKLARAHKVIGHITDLTGFNQEQLSETANLLARKVMRSMAVWAPLELGAGFLVVWFIMKTGLYVPILGIGSLILAPVLLPLLLISLVIAVVFPLVLGRKILQGQLLSFVGGLLKSAGRIVFYSKNSVITGLRFFYFRSLLKRHYGQNYFPVEKFAACLGWNQNRQEAKK